MPRALTEDRHVPLSSGLLPSAVQPIRLVIADEFPIFRDGLRRLLETDAGLQIVGDSGIGAGAVALVRAARPDILLLGPPSTHNLWLDTLRVLAEEQIPVRTILLVRAIDMSQVTTALQFGACGVVAKDSAADLLFKSIGAVMAGRYWVGETEAFRDVVASVRRLDHARRAEQGFGLTHREIDIVRAVVSGDTNKEVAAHLSISENTVKRHLLHIFNKVGVSSRVELALFAAHHRLLEGV